MITIRKATMSDLNDILGIIKDAQGFIKSNGVDQWQDGYPQTELLVKDIENNISYLALVDGKAAGTYAIMQYEEPSYKTIYGGKWLSDGKYITLHRFAVNDTYRHSGVGFAMFEFAEKQAILNNIPSLRADTKSDNIPMRSLMQKCGLEFCGTVILDGGLERVAYEKIILKQSL